MSCSIFESDSKIPTEAVMNFEILWASCECYNFHPAENDQ